MTSLGWKSMAAGSLVLSAAFAWMGCSEDDCSKTATCAPGTGAGAATSSTTTGMPAGAGGEGAATGAGGGVGGSGAEGGGGSSPVLNELKLSKASGHTCAALPDFTAKCWGSNDEGQLGNGTEIPSPTPVTVDLVDVVDVAVADKHSCARTIAGEVWCWGENFENELGNGPGDGSSTPVKVQGLSGVVAIAAAGESTCVVVEGGQGYCWGGVSPLGDGSPSGTEVPTPTPVGLTDLDFVSPGGGYACGLAAGSVSCWGGGSAGQLGNNGTPLYLTIPTSTIASGDVVHVASTGSHSCAVHDDGQVSCWGGDFGNQPLDLDNIDNVATLDVGELNFICVARNDGLGQCFGDSAVEPTGMVTSIINIGVADIRSVAMGRSAGCVVTGSDEVYCFDVANIPTPDKVNL